MNHHGGGGIHHVHNGMGHHDFGGIGDGGGGHGIGHGGGGGHDCGGANGGNACWWTYLIGDLYIGQNM